MTDINGATATAEVPIDIFGLSSDAFGRLPPACFQAVPALLAACTRLPSSDIL